MIETPRLILRQWKDIDVIALAQINADPQVMEFIGPVKSLDESLTMMENLRIGIEAYGYGLWAAELKETKKCIGFIGCWEPQFKAPFTPCIEIAWRLHPDHWGYGLAPEGARAVMADMFSRPGISELVSFTSALNTKSISVMKQIGMTTDPRDNYDHPHLPAGHPLRPHVLYRVKKS